MNDRELLELAAKAVGPEIEWDGDGWVITSKFKGHLTNYEAWNPRTDDGDGARMEAILGIHTTWHSDGVVCGKKWAGSTEIFDDHGGDKQSARRLASLRVAAEIGKAMP